MTSMKIGSVKAIGKEFLPPIVLKLIQSKRYADFKRRYSKPTGSHEQSAEYYDEAFLLTEVCRKDYTESNHYPLWSVLVDRLCRAKVESVLEIGCGPGRLAAFLRDKGLSRYLGFDFSSKNIEWARANCPEFDFVEADAFKTDLIHSHDYDTVVSTEFLEHVEQDLDVIKQIRSGTRFYGTVPNFPGRSHVRHFTNTQEVYDRYKDYFHSFSVDEFLGVVKGKKFYLMEGIKT